MPSLNRANSSPDLKDNWHSKLDSHSKSVLLEDNELDSDDDFYVIGDRVYVDGHRPGSVAYFGETEFGSGDWVGVVLDEPTGNHNGKLHGREYFQCAPFHGIFVRTHRVSRISDSALGSSAASSRCATPLPTFQRQRHDYIRRHMDGGYNRSGRDHIARQTGGPRDYEMTSTNTSGSQRQTRPSSRMSTGSSLLDTYYYDEDYRQDRVPTVASLAAKLKSMGEREEERRRQRQQHQQHQEQERQRPMSRATSLSSSASPIGILKRQSSHGSSSNSSSSNNNNNNNNSSRLQFADDNNDEREPLSPSANFGSRVDDLNRRLRAASASPSSSPRSVFNFRPKREQLQSSSNAQPQAAGINNYGKSKRSVYLPAVDQPQKGDRVLTRTERDGELSGILRFMGETNFATGEWAGIELDDPVGKNDGSILGCRYFYCPKNYGLFVPATRVRKHPDNRHERLTAPQSSSLLSSQALDSQYSSSNPSIFGSMRSTIKSPPPPPPLTGLSRYSSGSRSTTPSYDLGTLSPASNLSPSQQSSSNSATYQRLTSNYYPEYSGSSYLTSLTPSSLESRRNNENDCIPPRAPKRESSFNDSHSLFGDTPLPMRKTGDNNFKSSSSLFDSNESTRQPKFDDRDIEIQLNKSLSARPRATTTSTRSFELSTPKPKAVEYTFISNRLDGNPIARRTLIYK